MAYSPKQGKPIPQECLEFATPRQIQVINCINKHSGNRTAAARELKVEKSYVCATANAVVKRAAQRGCAPGFDLTHKTAPGFEVKGTSILYDGMGKVIGYWNKTTREGLPEEETVQLPDPKVITKSSKLYDASGKVIQQWVSEKPEDKQRQQLWKEFALELAEPVKGLAPIVKCPKVVVEDLLSVYAIGDHHLGMFSYPAETGEEYDLKEGERLLLGAIDELAGTTQPAGRALLLNLGDFFHTNDHSNKTFESGHMLDVDTRFSKIVKVGVRALRHSILRLLERHEIVEVWNLNGNHDPSVSLLLSIALEGYFCNEPRVVINSEPTYFKYLEFGKVMLAACHGDKIKLEEFPRIMATDQSQMWGRTEHRFGYAGHVHHRNLIAKEFAGAEVETFNTLAAKDSYHTQRGYRGKRKMTSITFHKEDGEVQRNVRGFQMLAGKS